MRIKNIVIGFLLILSVIAITGCTQNSAGEAIKLPTPCIDSDGGVNYYIKGEIAFQKGSGTTKTYTDLCQNTTTLDEYYCQNNLTINTIKYNCAYGCNNGACASCASGANESCGAGVGICTKGVRTCISGQWSNCQGAITPTTEKCNNTLDDDCDGVADENCETTQTCTDTDGGINYYKQGNISFDGNLGFIEKCLNSSVLVEYYCKNMSGAAPIQYKCPYDCFNGACIDRTNATTCSAVKDNLCPTSCIVSADADCCINAGKYWLKTSFGYGCYNTNYNPGCYGGENCSQQRDNCCPNWCGTAVDIDCSNPNSTG